MTAAAAVKQNTVSIERADLTLPILVATGRTTIAIRAGTVIAIDDARHAFEDETPVAGALVAGSDYGVGLDGDGRPYAVRLGEVNPLDAGWIGGFHYAPGGNATGRAGGDTTPAINPCSIWDRDFRPACPDPRGMALVDTGTTRIWADIYLLGTEHLKQGTSRHGATIADGRSRPVRVNGKGVYPRLDYATAVEIYAHHGKRLLGAEEFFAAAFGVEERCSRGVEPETTGELTGGAHRFISQAGLFDVTGTMWQWGTDGDPDNPRASGFGGSWVNGSGAGSRCAGLDCWVDFSLVNLSARGACDHLNPERLRDSANAA
ncbi:phage major tropism determinant [Shinella pollutisoli]|uniref:Major tropism determinant second domain-containing protein n=1 Tax=Shinella pollutisoli TaxID=2250594 RepID=A0ABV7DA23_9HYPH|nr:hypothetical protein [Shinella pollutisoli]